MGTVIAIDVRDREVPEEVLDSVFAWFHEVDATFSTFRSDSEISRLGRGEFRVSDCTRDVREGSVPLRGGSPNQRGMLRHLAGRAL